MWGGADFLMCGSHHILTLSNRQSHNWGIQQRRTSQNYPTSLEDFSEASQWCLLAEKVNKRFDWLLRTLTEAFSFLETVS